ncbi:putative protein fam50a [Toxoplasma gondii VAND]|uniref:FAM50A/XAP5 C-terminal domain-containing protein n=1 Tax=Toxoplasma gondii VAND TaxID=933077 RepID=A0A086Q1W4_TOXGO|nr:putative protein fam50a [Toxoplasma gondii VAND]
MSNLGESGNAVLQTIQASEGGRALRLLRQRQEMRERMRAAKEKIESKGLKRNLTFGGSAADRLEEQFKKETVGLITAKDFRDKRAKLEEQIRVEQRSLFPQKFQEKRRLEMRLAPSKLSFGEEADEVLVQVLEERDRQSKREEVLAAREKLRASPAPVTAASALGERDAKGEERREGDSCESAEPGVSRHLRAQVKAGCASDAAPAEAEKTGSEEGDASLFRRSRVKIERQDEEKSERDESTERSDREKPDGSLFRKRRIGKDPTIDTDFLPDEERDAQILAERKRLIEEYHRLEDEAKKEPLWITYSFWDGTGHRRRTCVRKGSSILEFLDQARKELEKEFIELRGIGAIDLMYIKEDLILPHSLTFYDLIKTKARGKSGPLFNFSVHEDVRMTNDSRVEKEDSHAGKVVERKWFERNKHIFPASRWEVFNPNKTYETYTVHGGVHKWKGVSNSEIRDAVI